MKATKAIVSSGLREKLIDDVHSMRQEAENLLGATLVECVRKDSTELRKKLAAAQKRLARVYAGAREKTEKGVRRGDALVRKHPYEALALSLGIGAVLGTLLHRQHLKGPARRS